MTIVASELVLTINLDTCQIRNRLVNIFRSFMETYRNTSSSLTSNAINGRTLFRGIKLDRIRSETAPRSDQGTMRVSDDNTLKSKKSIKSLLSSGLRSIGSGGKSVKSSATLASGVVQLEREVDGNLNEGRVFAEEACYDRASFTSSAKSKSSSTCTSKSISSFKKLFKAASCVRNDSSNGERIEGKMSEKER